MNYGMQMYVAVGLGLIVGLLILGIGRLLDWNYQRKWRKATEEMNAAILRDLDGSDDGA